FPADDGIRDSHVTGVQTCALPICWRATLIPLLAVPVSLVGTFVFFPLFGFSVNTISLLGLVLAIGIVVDDAIVVVEAVEHHIERSEERRVGKGRTAGRGRIA